MKTSSSFYVGEGFSRNQVILCVSFLFLLSIALYSNLFVSELIWDSGNVILDDPSVRDIKYLPSVLSEGLFEHIPSSGNNTTTMPYYRPLVKALHILEFSVFGESPLGYKIVNSVLNGLIVIFAFIYLLAITNNLKISFVAALLFAVNPVRVEAVAWVYSDSSLLLACFSFLTLYLFHREKHVFSLVIYGLALLSRETAVLIPAILLLQTWLFPSNSEKKRYIKIIPFVVVTGMYLVMRHAVVGSLPVTDIEMWTWFNTSAVILAKYLKVIFVPDAPVAMYGLKLYQSVTQEVLLAYATLFAAVSLGVYFFRDKKYLFWYAWFFIWISVSFNIGKISDYLMAEKALHLASFGPSVLLAIAASSGGRFFKHAAWVSILVLIPFHIISTYERTVFWKNTTVLLEKAIEFNNDFYMFHDTLADEYSNNKQYKKALLEYDEMKRINPERFATTYKYNNYGNLYYLNDMFDQAVTAWIKAIAIHPSKPEPYYNLWMVMKRLGKEQEAAEYYRQYMLVKAQASNGLSVESKHR